MKLWARKTYRIGMGSLFPIIYYFTPHKYFTLLVVAYFLGIMTVVEILRRFIKGAWKVMVEHSHGILKLEEARTFVGTTSFLIAVFIVIAAFDKSIAITAIVFLTFGDAMATIVGMKIGRIRTFMGKTLEGSIAFFVTCVVLGYLLSLTPRLYLSWPLILWGAAAATVIEMLPLRLDDNLTVGIGTAIVMQIVKMV